MAVGPPRMRITDLGREKLLPHEPARSAGVLHHAGIALRSSVRSITAGSWSPAMRHPPVTVTIYRR